MGAWRRVAAAMVLAALACASGAGAAHGATPCAAGAPPALAAGLCAPGTPRVSPRVPGLGADPSPAPADPFDAPDGSPGGWEVVDSPAPRTSLGTVLGGTACPSASDCWAVGWTGNGSSIVALAEHWDGQSWQSVPTPAPATGMLTVYGLDAVTCVAADQCWAVGGFSESPSSYRPLVERWDGRAWSIVDAPATGAVDVLLGATCASAADCWAVGYSFRAGWQSLIEHWDGTSWSRVDSPDPFAGGNASPPFNVLRSVACRSTADCWAAGSGKTDTGYRSLLAHWDGSRWSDVPAPAVDGRTDDALYGVACSSSSCSAVGVTGMPRDPSVSTTDPYVADPRPLIERWDGSGWSVVSSPLDAGTAQGQLKAIACGSDSDCVAVGYAADALDGAPRRLVERWDGSTWQRPPAEASGSGQTILESVSCAAPGACVAAGVATNALNVLQPVADALAEGRWRTTLTELTGEASASLRSVACPARSQCFAVGYDRARVRPLISRWDGERWALVDSPTDPSAIAEGLYGATCASGADCWAVGWAAPSGGFRTLAQHWDGSRWARVDTPDLSSAGQYLQGVGCASGGACWAVGATIGTGVGTQPLMERWDGRSWSIAASAAQAQVDGYLAAVTCASARDCWAVGGFSDGAAYDSLVEHWDGTAWTMAVTPALPVAGDTGLQAVTCVSPTDCWAVGGSDAGTRALALHWDGSSWTRARWSGAPDGVLNGVACRSRSRCWAVGASSDGHALHTIMATWDGHSWSAADAPSPGPAVTGDTLIGVTCVRGAPDCWAVGSRADARQLHTLVEHSPAAPAAPPSRAAASHSKRRVVCRRPARRHRAHRRSARRTKARSAARRKPARRVRARCVTHRARHRAVRRHRGARARHRRRAHS